MSFHLYQSNSLENLAGLFLKKLYENNSEIFTPVTAVVANGGMGAFLQRFIAGNTAVAANLQYSFLRDFITQSICCFLTPEEREEWRKSEENFSKPVLSWRINRIFTEHAADYPEWNGYFSSGNKEDCEKRRFELSAKLARLFDDYSLYCHEKLIAWQQGVAEKHPFGEQQKLYQVLTAGSNVPGREYFFDRFLKGENLQKPVNLPQKAGIFGIGCMPELYLKILVKLGQYCDIHLFCPMPSKEYSAPDKRPRKERIEAILNGEESFEHPLISDLGKSGTEFLNALLENDCFTGPDEDFFVDIQEKTTLLHQFQSDLLNQLCRKEPLTFPAEDDSIMLHSCHTVRRELEVLHDRLVQIFKKGSYTPEDVIVMFPNIDRYAPVIEAVFGNGPFAGKFSVCDRTQLESSPAVSCFLRLLKLRDSRFSAPEIMELLEYPFLMSRFDLDFTDLPELEKIILEADIHWGFDGSAHEHFCKVNFPEFSFQDGFDRQLEAFAHGQTGFSRAGLLSRFIGAVHAFEELRKALTVARTPDEWCKFLQNEVLERFFDCQNQEYGDELLELRKKIIDFGIAAHKAEYDFPVHIEVVVAALDFSGAVGRQSFLRGKMTFCSLVPLRAVPAKIIAVLGLNSEDFPPADSRDELNFLVKTKMPGVPSSSADSRYLLLETLTAAREKLILSYLGNSAEKEEKKEPAPPLGSILQNLAKAYGCKTEEFPLQSVALTPESGRETDLNGVAPGSVAVEPLEKLTLKELCDILLHPVNAWWRAHWKEEMELPENNTADEDEPLEQTPLLNAKLCSRFLELEQQQIPPEQCKEQLLKERILPLGGIGEECFTRAAQQLAVVPETLKEQLQPDNREIRMLTFQGKNGILLADRGPFYKAGAFKLFFSSVKPEKLLPVYIEQLLRCVNNEACGRNAVFILKDDYQSRKKGETVYKAEQSYQGQPFSPEEAGKLLNDLLDLAKEAREKVLPLFCCASSAYAESYQKGKSPEEAFGKAAAAFAGNGEDNADNFRSDIRSAAVSALFDSWEKVEEQRKEFEKLALRLYLPLYPPSKGRNSKPLPPDVVDFSNDFIPAGAEEKAVTPWEEVPLKGFSILEAAAGTGKTHNLKNIAGRILIERPEVKIENIVIVTFTRAAAGELRGRIRERLEALAQQNIEDAEVVRFTALSNLDPAVIKKRAKQALLNFDNAPIGTIHSFASRVLRDHGFGSKIHFDFTVEEDNSDALKLCLLDFYRNLRYADTFPQPLLELIFSKLSLKRIQESLTFYCANPECVPEQFPSLEALSKLPATQWVDNIAQLKLAVIGKALAWCRERMQEHNEKENVLSNDDLILELHKALKTNPKLREQLRQEYLVGLIDEFQDTDRKQFEIFKELFIDNPEGTLIVVGDPRQAIYRFRSGDIDTYFEACKMLQEKEAKIFQMNCNRRSTPALIQGFNAIFAQKEDAFARPGMRLPVQSAADPDAVGLLDSNGNPVETALSVQCIKGKVSEAIQSCAKEIAKLLNGNFYLPPDKAHKEKYPLDPGHIAVLVASWNKARQVRRALLKYNIPAICLHGENIFSSPTAKILQAILEAVVTPESPSARCRAQSAIGCVDGKLVEIEPELCCFLRDLWLKSSFMSMFNMLTEKLFIIERFSAVPGGERRIANWYQLGDLLNEMSCKKQLTPRALINELRMQITNPSSDEHLNAVRETDRGAVVIDTVFGSKGLAYPVVFLPDFFSVGNSLNKDRLSGKYHDNKGRICYSPDPDDTIQEQEKKEIKQENLRKFYVALTRARYYCLFFFGQESGHNSALDWLFRETVKDGTAQAPVSKGKKKKEEETTQLIFPQILTQRLPLAELPENFQLEVPPVNWRMPDHKTRIQEGRSFLSFSGLVQHDNEQLNIRFRSDRSDEAISPLPGGTMFGLAIHRILELTPFDTSKEKLEQLTKNVLSGYGFFDSATRSKAAEMIWHILNSSIPGMEGTFRLAEIPADKRMAEFEFLYETDNHFTRTKVLETTFHYFDAKFPTPDQEGTASGNVSFDGAFFNGFIDLFFEHQGKFYIVDWKTNMLGGSFEDYNAAGTAVAMRANGYCLQYLIYTVALMKYLSYRLNKPLNRELYDEMFGGIRYIFTRGISPDHPGCGIFCDRPAWDELNVFWELIAK